MKSGGIVKGDHVSFCQAATLRSDILPLRALEMAAWAATARLDGLIHHADHGSNYLAVVYTDRNEEFAAKPSTGTAGDSFDNALAEAVNGLYKTELIRSRGPGGRSSWSSSQSRRSRQRT